MLAISRALSWHAGHADVLIFDAGDADWYDFL